MSSKKEYILGVNQTELERLEFQHNVWKKVTDDFLEKINIKKGWKCLDVGSGPGFVSMDLLELAGDEGEITALEPLEFYLNYFKDNCRKRNLTNVKFINGNLEEVNLENEYYDLIYLRWVIDFVPEPEKFLLKLISALKKEGVIAIQDYNYDGIGLFPKGGPFDNIADVVRDYWKIGGGDPYFISKIPSLFKQFKIQLLEYSPIVQAGDPQSGVFRWADKFFSVHLQIMADKNVISQSKADEILDDWNAHKENPETIFFSPIVVNVIGKK